MALRNKRIQIYSLLQQLYSEIPYKLFKSGWAFPPWYYHIEFTRRCNLRCRMCLNIQYLENVPLQKQKEEELTTDEWLKVINQIGRFSLITFSGGEPMHRSDFFEVLEAASKKTCTHYLSNLTLLTDSYAEKTIDLAAKRLGGKGLNFVGVSLDGPEEIHNHIRRHPNAFGLTTNALVKLNEIRKTKKKKYPILHITTVIQQANIDVLEYIPEIVASLGVHVVNFVMETRIGDVPDLLNKSFHEWKSTDANGPYIERERLEKACLRTEQMAQKYGVEIRWPKVPHEELLNYYENKINLDHYICRSPWNFMGISTNGDVFTCPLCKIGTIEKNSLKELWNSEKSLGFRQTCREHLFPLCPGCCFLEYSKTKANNDQ
ncbi:MAG: radical SAM protein [Candidatus Hydrogenedentes bacterium]|nr:radical SAM protein [Candidatus Hydrogenedentota bacterium]